MSDYKSSDVKYEIVHTFGYQQACDLIAILPRQDVVDAVCKVMAAYAEGRTGMVRVECNMRMEMWERELLTGYSEGPGKIYVSVLDTVRICAELDETPIFMRCGGEDCRCDEEEECEACCKQESCWICDGLEAGEWLDLSEARVLMQS